jgi:hypothetical protein
MILTSFIFESVNGEEECPWYLNREDYPFEISDEDLEEWSKNHWRSTKSNVPKLFENYCNEHNFHQISRKVLDYDLSKSYETVEVVFSFEGKYYLFEFYSWDGGEECEEIGKDLQEVSPHTRTIEITDYY